MKKIELDFQSHYATLSDNELLRIKDRVADLTEEAFAALTGFGDGDAPSI